jgi:hypothetical protein
MEALMDDDLRNAFATLSAQISVVATDLRANTSLTADLNRQVSQVVVEQQQLRGDVKVLQRAVFGSDPPPAPARPIAESVTEHDGDIAQLAGQIIATRAEVAEVKRQNAEQLEMLSTIMKALGHPLLRKVAFVVGTLIVGWATAKGLLK